MIYLDNAATTEPCANAITEFMHSVLDFGNASSAYRFGTENRRKIEEARKTIADCINADPEEIYFTSGGTEGDNWFINSVINKGAIVTSSIEHPAILNTLARYKGRYRICKDVPGGIVDVESFRKIFSDLNDDGIDCAGASVMLVNNEIGTIQPIKELAKIAHEYGCLFHTDAVQAVGHMKIDVKDLDVDVMTASAHKFHGFKGVGFIYIKKGVQLDPFITGGHQEGGARGGTYNHLGIMAMSIALKDCYENFDKKQEMMEHKIVVLFGELKRLFKEGDWVLNTSLKNCVHHIISLRIPDVRAEELLGVLDSMGIYISTGSACTSEDNTPSHVLKAIGLTDEEANETIRISMSDYTTPDELKGFAEALKNSVELLKGRDKNE